MLKDHFLTVRQRKFFYFRVFLLLTAFVVRFFIFRIFMMLIKIDADIIFKGIID